MSGRTLTVGDRDVAVKNLDKVLFPDDGITKGDLIDHYRALAPRIVPFLAERPITVQRFPDGVGAGGFYQKHAPDHAPDWIPRARHERREDGPMTQLVADSPAALVWLANQGAVTLHAPLARLDRPDRPDVLVFDLDPAEDYDDGVRRTALRLREILDARGLVSFVKTTGSRGFHICVPLRRDHGFDAVRAESRRIAADLVAACPDLATDAQRKDRRQGKIFVDVNRNAYGQTRVAPYSVRARPGAPVAAPLRWDELAGADIHPRRYSLSNIRRRLAQMDDPWAGWSDTRNRLALRD